MLGCELVVVVLKEERRQGISSLRVLEKKGKERKRAGWKEAKRRYRLRKGKSESTT